jgi:hypothetical protein
VILTTVLALAWTTYFAIFFRTPWGRFARVGVALVHFPILFLLPPYRFRCPHCSRRDIVGKTCKGCGIAIGTPKSAVDEAERLRAAGPTAEPAPAVAKYRIANALADARANAVDDATDVADDASGARRGG